MRESAEWIAKEPSRTEIAQTRLGQHDPASNSVVRFTVRQSVSDADRAAQLDLRYRVLREPLGMTHEQAVFARDDDADTVHLLAVTFELGGAQGEAVGDDQDGHAKAVSVIGTATMITHGPNDVQLRGMATDSAWAGRGVGKAVLEAAHKLAGPRSLWCDARMSAHDFYARLGWVAEGEIFDIPQVGPHTVMRYRGSPSASD
jgi:GNAT superfamily N-acetyltransferase